MCHTGALAKPSENRSSLKHGTNIDPPPMSGSRGFELVAKMNKLTKSLTSPSLSVPWKLVKKKEGCRLIGTCISIGK